MGRMKGLEAATIKPSSLKGLVEKVGNFLAIFSSFLAAAGFSGRQR